jgi:hypothetical protein
MRPVSRAAIFACVSLLAAGAGATLTGCSRERGAQPARCGAPPPPDGDEGCAAGEAGFACRWSLVYGRRADLGALAQVLSGQVRDEDQALARLFPMIDGKKLVDAELPAPRDLVYRNRDFAPTNIPVPIDWSADPLRNVSWRAYYQNLTWIRTLDHDAAAFVVADWTEHALHRDPPLDWTWGDVMAHRLEAVLSFLNRYAAGRSELNRRVVRRAAETVLTAIYTTVQPQCYTRHHNHGVMQDLKLMRALAQLPNLRDRDAMRDLARRRLIDQFPAQLTSDGMVVENSPWYHVLMLELVTSAIEEFTTEGLKPPDEIVSLWTRAADTLVYLIQPNLTLPQFGATMNTDQRSRLKRLVDKARAMHVGDSAPWDRLAWIVTSGRKGVIPDHLDRVWTVAHYAAFRERWDAKQPASPITAHFKCSRLSKIHYDRDELSIEIYGRGGELIVDSGLYSNEARYELSKYQGEPWAHNTLVVDGKSYDPKPTARITAHSLSDVLSWVQATHDNYKKIGIERQYRTFAYARPNAFAVVDEIRAPGAHEYVQHFHLHPRLTEIQRLGTSAVLARAADGTGAAVMLVALQPVDEIAIGSGGKSGGPGSSWYFPKMNDAVVNRDVMFRYRRPAGKLDFPVLLFVLDSPDAPRPDGFAWHRGADELRVTWRESAGERTIALPPPPP